MLGLKSDNGYKGSKGAKVKRSSERQGVLNESSQIEFFMIF